MTIFPGSSVTSQSGRSSTISPMILCEGAWYSFVPKHTFKAERRVMQAGTGLVIGEIVSERHTKAPADYPDMAEAFHMFRFNSYAPISVSKHVRVTCIEPIDVLGEIIRKTRAMGSESARVVSIDGPFAMRTDDGILTYSGAFELKSDDGIAVGKLGDGGSSFVANHNQLVGVILGGAGESTYCASGKALLQKFFPDFEHLEMVA